MEKRRTGACTWELLSGEQTFPDFRYVNNCFIATNIYSVLLQNLSSGSSTVRLLFYFMLVCVYSSHSCLNVLYALVSRSSVMSISTKSKLVYSRDLTYLHASNVFITNCTLSKFIRNGKRWNLDVRPMQKCRGLRWSFHMSRNRARLSLCGLWNGFLLKYTAKYSFQMSLLFKRKRLQNFDSEVFYVEQKSMSRVFHLYDDIVVMIFCKQDWRFIFVIEYQLVYVPLKGLVSCTWNVPLSLIILLPSFTPHASLSNGFCITCDMFFGKLRVRYVLACVFGAQTKLWYNIHTLNYLALPKEMESVHYLLLWSSVLYCLFFIFINLYRYDTHLSRHTCMFATSWPFFNVV